MSPALHRLFVRSAWLTTSFALVLCTSFHASGFDDKDKDKSQRQGSAAIADRGQRMVDLGRQSGPDVAQCRTDLQECDAERRRHEPAQV